MARQAGKPAGSTPLISTARPAQPSKTGPPQPDTQAPPSPNSPSGGPVQPSSPDPPRTTAKPGPPQPETQAPPSPDSPSGGPVQPSSPSPPKTTAKPGPPRPAQTTHTEVFSTPESPTGGPEKPYSSVPPKTTAKPQKTTYSEGSSTAVTEECVPKWSEWSAYEGDCTAPCGLCGKETSSRTCSCGECSGPSTRTKTCGKNTLCLFPKPSCCLGNVKGIFNNKFMCVPYPRRLLKIL